MSTVTHADEQRLAPRATLPVIMLALATVVSAMASLNVAIPSIARDTHATQTQLSWIIDAYALVFAALLLLGGAIGDRYGRRRALLAGLVIFGAGSVAATTVSDPTWLIAMRGVLGVGAALVMPATLSTITSTFPPEQKTRAVGAWAGVAGASAIVGLLASGVVLEAWSWRSVFALNVVLAVIAIIGTLRVIPESADPRAPRLDLVGALITVAGLGVLVYSVIEAPSHGWGSAHTLGGIAIGLLILVGFVRWELTRENPLIDPRLFRNRALTAATLSITFAFFAFFGFVFLVLQYLQLVRGDSPLVAAVSLIPMALALMPSARVIAPRLAGHLGVMRVSVLGLALVAAGLLVLSRLDGGSSYWLLFTGLVPLGAGMGLAMTPATAGRHRCAAGRQARCRIGVERPRSRAGRSARDRRAGQRAAVHLPQPPRPGRATRPGGGTGPLVARDCFAAGSRDREPGAAGVRRRHAARPRMRSSRRGRDGRQPS